jgi:hypothetical protein
MMERIMDEIETLIAKEKEIAQKIEAIQSGVEGLYPVVDGVLDIEKYLEAKYKILWLLREPHDEWVTVKETGQRRNGGWNLAKGYSELKLEDINKKVRLVARRIMEATYRILPETQKPLEAFKSVACINIKKIPGGRYSIQKEIKQAYNEHKDLLKEQIEAYNPDIVICGNTLPYLSMDNYFVKKNRKTFGINPKSRYCYYALENRLYINIYHPAAWRSWSKCVENIFNAVSDWEINSRRK